MTRAVRTAAIALYLSCGLAANARSEAADQIYLNGRVFTAVVADATPLSAIAVRDGRIVYAGSDAGVKAFVGPDTLTEDLGGRFVMPGIIDGHMHPFDAGVALLKCNLDYASLTVAELQQRVQTCLDARAANDGPDAWLDVVNWFQEDMRPAGVRTSRADLDALHTRRPIIVRSSFGHTVLANSRALALAGIDAHTSDPLGGKIWRDEHGEPTGLLEDAAFAVFDRLVPPPTPHENIEAARAALAALARQGVTSFLDAWATTTAIEAFKALRKEGALSARAHFAPVIEPTEAGDPAAAVARIVALAKRYDEGELLPRPGITLRNAKLFMDGVIAAPALTGAMLEPYRMNAGTADAPHWVVGTSRGPAPYFAPQPLAQILIGLGRAGIDPHLHADGDGAVHAALDGIAALRAALPDADVRPAIAHDEIVAPADMRRFAALDAMPVLSFQWGKPAGDTLGLRDYFGPERMAILEPSGLLAASGAHIAFGSDWPVDRLDEWFAFKVAVTRTNAPEAGAEYAGRLGTDPGLSVDAVLRAATIGAAHELHQDAVSGSLEPGKFADFIVLDRDPFTIPPQDIAKIRVLRTVVGGRSVFRADTPSETR